MGAGQINAAALLKLIDGVTTPMQFPNLYIEEGGQMAIRADRYYVDGNSLKYEVKIENGEVASCTNQGNGMLIFEGKKSGTTKASLIVSGSETDNAEFTITVRKGASNNGWL